MAIAKVRIYDQVLSAAQIASQYNAEKAEFPGALKITSVSVNPVTGAVTFDWVPRAGETYAVETNADATNPAGWGDAATGVTSGSYTFPAGLNSLYGRLRVE